MQSTNGNPRREIAKQTTFVSLATSTKPRGRPPKGKVWDDPEQGEIVAKLKADNISVMALHVGSGGAGLSNEPRERPLLVWVRSAMAWVRSCIRRESD